MCYHFHPDDDGAAACSSPFFIVLFPEVVACGLLVVADNTTTYLPHTHIPQSKTKSFDESLSRMPSPK